MSLNGALQVGRSALISSQVGLQVAGDNMANAATPGFHRRTVHLAALRDQYLGPNVSVGRGVRVTAVRREIDVALQARLRDALGQQHKAQIGQSYLAALESVQNELTGNDLSSKLSTFFNSFSELANNPDDGAIRAVVIQEGRALADRIATIRRDQQALLRQVDADLAASTTRADELLEQIADLNGRIATSEPGGGSANALRDRRDMLVDELATFIDVSVIEQPNGLTDILVGSMPVVLGNRSRGIELRIDTVNGQTETSLRVAENGTELQVTAGRLGGLLGERGAAIQGSIDGLDTLAAELIFQVNRVHSQGQGTVGFASVAAGNAVDDATANLNSTAAGLPFRVESGSFFVHVTHRETGVRTTHQITVDGDADSLDDLVNEINVVAGVPNVTAGTGSGGTLTLDADPGFEISFSDDTSGALAALGVNTFFSGSTAFDIDVNQALVDDPALLAAGGGHVPGSNDTALAIAALQDTPMDALGGRSLRDDWLARVGDLAVRGRAAADGMESAALVSDSLAAQVQAVSGVSLDEEAINLLTFQRQFQAAARFINVIDETLQVLLSIA